MRYRVLYNESRSRFFDPADTVERADYQEVATVEAIDHNKVFEMMNVVYGDELPCKLRIRSMSTGDLLVDEAGTVMGCCGCGWKEVQLVG